MVGQPVSKCVPAPSGPVTVSRLPLPSPPRSRTRSLKVSETFETADETVESAAGSLETR